MKQAIGLIAGGGTLPLLEARGIAAAGRRVCCVGLAGQYDPRLPGVCDEFAVAGMLRLGRWVKLLRRWGVSEAVMVGGVRKARMYEPWRWLGQLPDRRALHLWYRVLRHDKRNQTVLEAVANELARSGITLIDTTRYIAEQMATEGVMSSRGPTAEQQADIAFGWPALMRMNDLDIGQAIAVKERNIIAVEAIEGTDAMIERAGALCRAGGWTLLKGPRPEKDPRFDVPTVGVQTIEKLKSAGARCLAVSAGKVILAEKDQVIAAADRAGIALVGVKV
jgi:hypothetical protein